jgi:hypothetical protein
MDVMFEVNELTPANLLNNDKFDGKYEPVFLLSDYDKEIRHRECIFKHSSGFYLYLSRFETETTFKIKLIYKSENYEQIKIFINGLKKLNEKWKSQQLN